MVFSRNEEVVLVADKTGEVWQYSVTQLTLPGTHLLGHFSMLLDMVGHSLLLACSKSCLCYLLMLNTVNTGGHGKASNISNAGI